MSDKNNNFNIGDLASTASAYSAESDERREQERKRKLLLFKLGAMGVLTAIIIIIGSIAWFTMSEEVEGTGARMTANEVPFELMVTGDTTRSEILELVEENKTPKYSVGNLFQNTAKHYVTSSDENNMHIQWAGGTDEELEPGQSGDLTFYIIPNENITANQFVTMYGDMKLFKMSIKGYRTVETENEQTGEKDVTGLTDMETLSAFDGTVSYLNGHFLFFKTHTITRDAEDQTKIISDKYTGLIDTTDRFSLKETDYSIENGMIKVVLHWKWPTTFPKMIGSYSDVENVSGDTATTQALIKYVLLHADRVLYGTTVKTVSEEDTLDEELLKSKFGIENINDLSKQYNRADSRIGADAHYVMFVLNATYK